MASLIDFVEGLGTAALKYFFDDKEPVLVLQPTENILLTKNEILGVIGKALGNDASTLDGKDRIFLTVPGQNRIMGGVSYVPEMLPDQSRPEVSFDEMHRCNMSLLWQFNDRLKNIKNTSAENLRLFTKVILAMVATNRGRLTTLHINHCDRAISLGIEFLVYDAEECLYKVYAMEFVSDNYKWDFGDIRWKKDPKQDRYNFYTVYKDGLLNYLCVTYNNIPNKPDVMIMVEPAGAKATTPVHFMEHPVHTAIPNDLYSYLELAGYLEIVQKINPETGKRIVTHTVVNRHERVLTVTIEH